MPIKLSEYEYILPKDYIAQYPKEERDTSRLAVVNRQKKSVEHKNFKDIIDYLNKNDALVLNNTKVLPARLYGNRITGGKVEILLLGHNHNKRVFECLIRPGRIKIGEKIKFPDKGLEAALIAKDRVEFNTDDTNKIYSFGNMPLPPYIKRSALDSDRIRYQTVYAKNEGSVAAPTAGLHFTESLLEKIRSKGVNVIYLTVHIGYSTFKPIKSDYVEEHRIGSEYYSVPGHSWEALRQAHSRGGRIFAVGTSSTRALETLALSKKCKLKGSTGIFIYPGFKFKIVDCLVTNFHHPHTTPFMLVAGFIGNKNLLKKAYKEAVEEKYRFLSFGDSMLVK